MSFFSVIVTCHNERNFIESALESVTNQTRSDLIGEILIIDDGSEDESFSVIENFAVQKSNVTPIFQRNKGLPSARNAGIKAASCGWLAFLDGDDVWFKEKLEYQYEFIQNNRNVSMIYTECVIFDAEGVVEKASGFTPKSQTPLEEYFIKNGGILPSTAIVEKSCVDKVGFFNEELIRAQDTEFWLRIMKNHRVAKITRPLVYRRRHPKALGQDYEKKYEFQFLVSNIACVHNEKLLKYKHRRDARLHLMLGMRRARDDKRKLAIKSVIEGFKKSPVLFFHYKISLRLLALLLGPKRKVK